MSDIKFSEFTEFTSETENMEYVGFDGIQNFRIKKDNAKKSILPLLNIYGYSIAHDTDTDHDITFGAGVCSDSTGAYLLSGSASVKRIDASWSAGTGNGGLFFGSVGNNTVYYMFVIRKDSDGSIDYGFDTSIAAANRPAGYTYYRMISIGITNSSANWIQGAWWRENNKIYFKPTNFILERALAALANTSRILLTITAPPLSYVNLIPLFFSADSNVKYYNFGETSETDSAPTTNDNSMHVIILQNALLSYERTLKIDSNKQVYVRGSSTAISMGLKTILWYYNL